MRKTSNNKGITLVELIVSIAILAIIVLPLLNAFVVATRTNVKAKRELRASQVASNVMEGIENIDISDISYQFNYSSEGFSLFKLTTESKTGELIPKDATALSFTQAVKTEDVTQSLTFNASTRKNSDGSSDFIENSDGKYYYYVTNLISDDKIFDAIVTVDANLSDTLYNKYNTSSLASIDSMNTNTDAISANSGISLEVINDIKEATGYVVEQKDITRIITVDVSKSLTNVTTVKVSYNYECYIQSEGKYITFPKDTPAYIDGYTSVIYDNSTHNTDNLENIYLMINPWYTATSRFPSCKDKIELNNPDYIDCTVHIVKQNITDAQSLYQKELNYKTAVYLNEFGNTAMAHMKIETNLGSNMADENVAVAEQVTYIYNNTMANQNKIKDYIIFKKLTEQEAKGRLYNVTVDVYPSGLNVSDISSADKIVTLTGGITSE